MQNPLQKFRQSSIGSKKPSVLSEQSKHLTRSNSKNVCKRVYGIFSFFYLDLKLLMKMSKHGFSDYLFHFLQIS